MVNTREVVRFWLPLSFTWLIMAVEGPTLTAIVARLDNATYNLAAYGLAVAFAMLVEAPIVNLLSASVALAKDRAAADRLRAFMIWMNVAITMAMVVICIPQVFNVIAYDLIGLIPEIADRFHLGLMVLIPWPAAIGFRRFYQGLMIRNNQTRNVAIGTIVRLLAMAVTATVLVLTTDADGIIIGTAGLSAGVMFEALATRWMARNVVRSYTAQNYADCEPPPTNKKILQFYTPLALTSVIGFVTMPMLSFFMNQAPDAVASLAVLPVVNAFIFLFRSFGFSFQEVGIAFLGQSMNNYAPVRKVGLWITVCTTLALSMVAFSPLLGMVMEGAFGLSHQLAEFARIPTIIMIVMPFTSAIFSLQRSVMIATHHTMQVTITMVLEVGLILLIMAMGVVWTDWNGAVAASIAMCAARLCANLYAGVVSTRLAKGHTT